MSESPSLLLQRAADLIESRAGDVLAKDWVWDEDIYRVMSRPHAGDVAICSTDLPEGQWIAMANPLWAAPLVAWLRYAQTMYEMVERRAAAVGITVSPDGHVSEADRSALALARLVLSVSAEGMERSDPPAP